MQSRETSHIKHPQSVSLLNYSPVMLESAQAKKLIEKIGSSGGGRANSKLTRARKSYTAQTPTDMQSCAKALQWNAHKLLIYRMKRYHDNIYFTKGSIYNKISNRCAAWFKQQDARLVISHWWHFNKSIRKYSKCFRDHEEYRYYKRTSTNCWFPDTDRRHASKHQVAALLYKHIYCSEAAKAQRLPQLAVLSLCTLQ